MQLVVVLVLLLVLVAIPLYLWRRPRTEQLEALAAFDASSEPIPTVVGLPEPSLPTADAGFVAPPGMRIEEARVLECHDPGSKRTLAKDCDPLQAFQKAFAQAIADNASCVPSGMGGVVVYEADVSFARKKQPVLLSLPREGRTLKSGKAAAACGTAIKKTLSTLVLDDAGHQHARYRIAIAASYSGASSHP